MPVTMGTATSRSLETENFRVTEAWFASRAYLPPHTHDRPIFSVMMQGAFRTRIAQRELSGGQGTAFTEPRGESHANLAGVQGAMNLIVQPDPTRTELLHPFAALLDR